MLFKGETAAVYEDSKKGGQQPANSRTHPGCTRNDSAQNEFTNLATSSLSPCNLYIVILHFNGMNQMNHVGIHRPWA